MKIITSEQIFEPPWSGHVHAGPGSTFPLHHDPLDRNIRIAPSYPPLDELKTAIELFCVCVKLAGVRKLLADKKV